MPPLPKRRTPSARQGERRAHLGLVTQGLAECPQCHTLKLPYHACPNCGTYNGREVIKTKTEKKPNQPS